MSLKHKFKILDRKIFKTVSLITNYGGGGGGGPQAIICSPFPQLLAGAVPFCEANNNYNYKLHYSPVFVRLQLQYQSLFQFGSANLRIRTDSEQHFPFVQICFGFCSDWPATTTTRYPTENGYVVLRSAFN